jgi:CRP/FNR family transcriptional regulator, anaerobic regulatory protein
MKTQILASIKTIVKLEPAEEKAFLNICEIKKYKKKEFLLTEGKVCNKISFINKGCMRLFYSVEGHENTVQFFFSDAWYTDYSSFLTDQPSMENMQALQDCEVIEFRKDDLNELCNEYPIFDRVARIMAENAFLSLSKLNKMLTNEDPELRYLNLLKKRPELMEQIPQHYIASYLGIKPESLSRIRKRIAKDK